MASQLAREMAAQAWGNPSTKHLAMIPELAESFAEILDESWAQSLLQNASTGELLDDLRARAEWNGTINYRPAESHVS